MTVILEPNYLMACLCEPVGELVVTPLGAVHMCDKHGGAIPMSDLLTNGLHVILHHRDENGEIVPLRVREGAA